MVPIFKEFDGYKDHDKENSTPLLNSIKFGLLGSIIVAILLTISRRLFKVITLILNICVILTFVGIQRYLENYSYEEGHDYVHKLIYLNGFVSFPLIFIFFEWAIAITPLISVSLSSGNINMQNCFCCMFAFAAVVFDIKLIPWFDEKP